MRKCHIKTNAMFGFKTIKNHSNITITRSSPADPRIVKDCSLLDVFTLLAIMYVVCCGNITLDSIKKSETASKGVKTKLIHISTDEVYGDIKGNNRSNENHKYEPSSPYSASKASSDHFVRAFVGLSGPLLGWATMRIKVRACLLKRYFHLLYLYLMHLCINQPPYVQL